MTMPRTISATELRAALPRELRAHSWQECDAAGRTRRWLVSVTDYRPLTWHGDECDGQHRHYRVGWLYKNGAIWSFQEWPAVLFFDLLTLGDFWDNALARHIRKGGRLIDAA